MGLKLAGGGLGTQTLAINANNELCFNSNPIIPIGFIAAFYRSSAPDTTWLACDGSQFDTTVYTALYSILGSDHLPDLREATLKGIGLSSLSNNHVTPTGLVLGQFVGDTVMAHSHGVPVDQNSGSNVACRTIIANGNTEIAFTGVNSNFNTNEVKAVGVLWCIKAK